MNIELTVQVGDSLKSYTFKDQCVEIGNGSIPSNDISFPNLPISGVHLEIICDNTTWWIFNSNQDSKITLNGKSFEKSELLSGDEILIHDQLVRIDHLTPTSSSPHLSNEHLEKALEKLMKCPPPSEEISSKIHGLHLESHRKFLSLKDGDDDNEQTPLSLPSSWNWKASVQWICSLVVLISFLAAFFLAEVYLKLESRGRDEEMKAAAGIADVAMALTYAHIHHPSLDHQNWTDPEFINNNLMAIMPNKTNLANEFFNKEKTPNPPYLLRIYTNPDLSQFLVLAQPTANFWQWLLPKKAILVNSKEMDLRLTDDVKELNRILAYSNPFENPPAQELGVLIDQSEVIHLQQLAKRLGRRSFNPPTVLGILRPGAENFIYNAPRYRIFGENLIQETIALSDYPISKTEGTKLNAEIEKLKKFSNMVIYVPEKLARPEQIQHLIARLGPSGNFLMGYLLRDEKGKVKSSHLMMHPDNSLFLPPHSSHEQILEEVAAIPGDSPSGDHIISSPLYHELSTLASIRQASLKKKEQSVTETLHHLTEMGSKKDQELLHMHLKEYEKEERTQALHIQQEILRLKRANPEVSEEEFNRYLTLTKLNDLLAEKP